MAAALDIHHGQLNLLRSSLAKMLSATETAAVMPRSERDFAVIHRSSMMRLCERSWKMAAEFVSAASALPAADAAQSDFGARVDSSRGRAVSMRATIVGASGGDGPATWTATIKMPDAAARETVAFRTAEEVRRHWSDLLKGRLSTSMLARAVPRTANGCAIKVRVGCPGPVRPMPRQKHSLAFNWHTDAWSDSMDCGPTAGCRPAQAHVDVVLALLACARDARTRDTVAAIESHIADGGFLGEDLRRDISVKRFRARGVVDTYRKGKLTVHVADRRRHEAFSAAQLLWLEKLAALRATPLRMTMSMSRVNDRADGYDHAVVHSVQEALAKMVRGGYFVADLHVGPFRDIQRIDVSVGSTGLVHARELLAHAKTFNGKVSSQKKAAFFRETAEYLASAFGS